MPNEIIIASLDSGVQYSTLNDNIADKLYTNDGDSTVNRRDDDRNGLVDDITGPGTGPSSNGFYVEANQLSGGGLSSHGTASVRQAATQILALEQMVGSTLPVSIMPDHFSFSNILEAAQYGASVISLSYLFSAEQRAYISDLVSDYDVIVVVPDRDTANSTNPDAEQSYDNVIEVGLISNAIVKGTGNVDILEQGVRASDTSESGAVAIAAGKIGAIWGLNPEWMAAEVVAFLGRVTETSNPIIAQQGLSSEMGGQLSLSAAVDLLGTDTTPPPSTPQPEVDPPQAGPVSGYTSGTAGADTFVLGRNRVDINSSGRDTFILTDVDTDKAHRIRQFEQGETIDLRQIIDPTAGKFLDDYVRLEEKEFAGDTHTFIQIDFAGTGQNYYDAIMIQGVSLGTLSNAIASGHIIANGSTSSGSDSATPPSSSVDTAGGIAAFGYDSGTTNADTFILSSPYADVKSQGQDSFVLIDVDDTKFHRIRQYEAGEVIDLSQLFDRPMSGDDWSNHVRLDEKSWSGTTSTMIEVDRSGLGRSFEEALFLTGVDAQSVADAINSDTILI